MTQNLLKVILVVPMIVTSLILPTPFITSNPLEGYVLPKKQISQEVDLAKSIQRGEGVYIDFCMQCHGADGKGSGASFPPLAGSDWLTSKRKKSIHAVKYGIKGKIMVNGITYNSLMSPQGLSDQEVMDVMNYIMNTWENTQQHPVTLTEIQMLEK